MDRKSNSNLVEIYKGLIKPGKPLVVPLYRNDGTLLFQKHKILTKEQTLGALQHGNIYTLQTDLLDAFESINEENEFKDWQRAGPGERTKVITDSLEAVLSESQTDLSIKVLLIVNQIKILCDTDANQAMVYCLLERFKNTDYIHPVFVAILIYLCCTRFDWKENEINKLMCAALTINYINPESDTETEPENNFPMTVKNLEKVGVTDKTWLMYIEQQHEASRVHENSATNYDILWGSALLDLANHYAALVLGHGRAKAQPSLAIQHALVYHKSRFMDINKEVFLKTVGQYPVGTLIRFSNDNLGIVVKQGDTPDTPFARIFCDIKKRRKHHFPLHHVGIAPYNVKEIIFDETYLGALDPKKIWHS